VMVQKRAACRFPRGRLDPVMAPSSHRGKTSRTMSRWRRWRSLI
jgi:hypothetical protein